MSDASAPFKISEAAFQRAVIEIAKWERWLVHHTRPAQMRSGRWATPIQGDAGFPDLVLAHPARGLIFAELKSAVGRVSDQQTEWLETLRANGVEAYIWRPRDLQTIRLRLGRNHA